jgi:hypothetical protein
MRGEGRQPSGASIRLLTRGEGWATAVHAAVAPIKGARRQRGSARGRRRPREMGQTSRFGQMGRLGSWAGEGFRAKIKDLNRCASDLIFELISRILSLKSKVSNISN